MYSIKTVYHLVCVILISISTYPMIDILLESHFYCG